MTVFQDLPPIKAHTKPLQAPLVRIVKMTFKPGEAEAFAAFFETVSEDIRNFPGCHSMQLLRVSRQPHVLFTVSQWEGQQSLDSYRYSEFFRSVWGTTKGFFAEKAEAWSLEDTGR